MSKHCTSRLAVRRFVALAAGFALIAPVWPADPPPLPLNPFAVPPAAPAAQASPPPAKPQAPAPAQPQAAPQAPAAAVPPPGQMTATITTHSGVPVVVSGGTPSSRGVPVKRPVGDAPMSGITLRFDNADIYEVIQAVLGDMLKLDYLIDPGVQGKITVNTAGAVSLADVYNVLESVLALNNISIIRDGRVYKVVRDAGAVRDNLGFEAAGENSPLIQIIPLKFVQASQLVNTLKSFIGTQASMTNDPTNHYLIVADRATNVAKILDMVKVLDVDYLQHVRIKLVQIEKGDATEMAREMEALFKTSGMFNWSGTEGNKVFFLPVIRMNAVLVAAANDAILTAAEQWIKTLDDEPKNGLGANIHVYPVANSNAAHIANILRQLYGGQAAYATSTNPAAGTTPPPGTAGTATDPTRTIQRGNVPTPGALSGAGAGLAGSVQIIADEATNTLVIKASPQDFIQIKKVIERIDTIPRQVLIQVMVAEIALTDNLQYGVEWWMKSTLSKDGKSWPSWLGLEGTVAPPITTQTPSVTGSASGLNYVVFNGAGSVVGLLNLLSKDTDISILSAPHVLASDGKSAKIEVGADEPVVTQTVSTPSTGTTTTGLTTSNSVQYRPTGILLDVKPSINASGRVTLSVTQEVSARGSNVNVGGSTYPAFKKRKVTTEVTLEEGKTLMIAGLIESKGNKNITGAPFLKDIPLLGMLFGTTTNDRDKTELMITITPYVVRNREEGDRITSAFAESLRDLKGLMQNTSNAPRLDVARPAAVQPTQAN